MDFMVKRLRDGHRAILLSFSIGIGDFVFSELRAVKLRTDINYQSILYKWTVIYCIVARNV